MRAVGAVRQRAHMPPSRAVTARLAIVRERVRERATSLGGVFRRVDLREWGESENDLDAMLRRGWWTRLHRRVYVDTDLLAHADSTARHLLGCAASVIAVDCPAFAYAATGAAVHELALPAGRLDRVRLIRPPGHDPRALRRRLSNPTHLAPVEIHTHALRPGDTLTLRGIPTVNRAIAAVTAAAACDRDWATAVLDSAAWRGAVPLEELFRTCEEYGAIRGIGVVRAALPDVRAGAQSPLETFSRLRLVRAGLAEPRLQVPLYDTEGLIGYVDALFDELGVVGEADGKIKYGADPATIVAEKRREDRIRALGYAVVRWTWDEVMRTPGLVATRILDASRWSARRTG